MCCDLYAKITLAHPSQSELRWRTSSLSELVAPTLLYSTSANSRLSNVVAHQGARLSDSRLSLHHAEGSVESRFVWETLIVRRLLCAHAYPMKAVHVVELMNKIHSTHPPLLKGFDELPTLLGVHGSPVFMSGCEKYE